VDVALNTETQGTGIVTAMSVAALTGGLGPNLAADTNLTIVAKDSDLESVTITDVMFLIGDGPNTSQVLAKRAVFTTPLVSSVNDQLKFYARTGGSGGNDINVRYINPLANNATLSVTEDDGVITVNLATNGSGVVTTTAANVRSAIEANVGANNLVFIRNVGNGSGVVAAMPPSPLVGGEDPRRYLTITSVTLASGGTAGDSFKINTIVERNISL
jgi:hypothetical protein